MREGHKKRSIENEERRAPARLWPMLQTAWPVDFRDRGEYHSAEKTDIDRCVPYRTLDPTENPEFCMKGEKPRFRLMLHFDPGDGSPGGVLDLMG